MALQSPDDITVPLGDEPEPEVSNQPFQLDGEEPEEYVDASDKEQEPFVYDESLLNLVESFEAHPDGVEALKEIARQIVDQVEESYDNSEEYRRRMANDWAIFSGELPEKKWPHRHAANAHVPIMLENLTRITFRAYAELFGDWNNVFGVAALGQNDEEAAKLLTLHGNWQLRKQIPDFKRQMARMMLAFFTNGDVTCHSFYSESLRQNRHEILTPDEFITPYVYTTTMPNYGDVPWTCKIIHKYGSELKAMKDWWTNVDKLIDGEAPSFDDEPEQLLSDKVARVQGIEAPESVGSSPYKLYWWEGNLELPNQDSERYCKVVLDPKSRLVLELSIQEEPNWQDLQRFETQKGELDSYRSQQEAHVQMLQDHIQQSMEVTQQVGELAPEMGPLQTQAAMQGLQQSDEAASQLEPPVPPEWMLNPDDPEEMPEEPRKEPIRLFTHFVCLEPLVGNLGYGYGRFLADHNRAADTALQQFTDAATLANVRSFIVPDAIEVGGGGDILLEPGKMNKISGLSPSEIKDSIIPLEVGPANPQLLELVKMMQEAGSASAQAPEVLSGAPGKSGETFRGISARIEQATKQLSVATRKAADGLENVLVNNARLNAKYLEDEELFHVAETKGAIPIGLKIGRRLYERNYHVEIRADLRFASQAQKVQEADEMLGLVLKIPQLQGNAPLIYQCLKGVFVSRDRGDLLPFLGPELPPPQTPLGIPAPQPPPPMMGPAGPPQPGPPGLRPQGGPIVRPQPKPPGVPGPGGQPAPQQG